MFEESSLMLWLLIASLALNLITMVLVIMLVRRKDNRRSAQLEQQTRGEMAITKQVKSPAVSGVVFCRNCGKQYDSSTPECPNCQTAR